MRFNLKVEPQLAGAFLRHLKGKGFVVTPTCNPRQPYWINHHSTPDMTHIIETDEYGKWLVPEKLHQIALHFLCHKAG